jgi:hypothetical protein
MTRGSTRFLLIVIAVAVVIALSIHLFAPGAIRALGRSIHGG